MAHEVKTLATVDRDVPDVITDLQQGPWAMTQIDPKVELAKFEAAAELQRKLIPASIRATRPQDWISMGGKVYLQATGVERIASLWGLVFGEPEVTRENNDDGTFAYVVVGPAGSRLTGVFYKGIVGGRSSADPFFDSFDEEKPSGFRDLSLEQKESWKREHRIAPDPLDVRKAAVTNWQVRAASMLAGLRGLTPQDLSEAGIRGVTEVQYGSGARGGETVPADLKAEQVKLGNEVLKAASGDKEAARQLMVEITSDEAKGFKGFDSALKLTKTWQFEKARKKLAAHPVFGRGTSDREPGAEG